MGINDYLNRTRGDVEKLVQQSDTIKKVMDIIKNSKLIYLAGNGGSSANASHFANDLNKICGIPSICLSDSIPFLTAVANDISYKDVFSQQISRKFIDLIGNDKVTLIIFSGSGDSKNILDVVHYAKSLGIHVIAFLGMTGGKVKLIKGIEVIHIPTEMLHAEDIHLVLCHLLTTLIKENAVE